MKKARTEFRPAFPHGFAVLLLLLCFAGCGGGGGGGGAAAPAPTPPVTPGSPPVQSNWSPAKNATIATISPTVTFSTDVSATCRWALSDLSYSQMSGACSGGGSRNHSCATSGLGQGLEIIYFSCRSADGAEDSSSTNEDISYTVDSIAPQISIVYPSDGAEFLNYTRPSYVSTSYSDAGSGVSVPSLSVTFTLQGREVDMTDLFAKSASANASQSRTPASNTDPMALTAVSRFGNSALAAAGASWTLARSGIVTMQVIPVDSQRLFIWDSAGASAWLLDASAGSLTQYTPFSSAPLSVAVSALSDRFYAVFSGDPNLYSFMLSTGARTWTQPLPGAPAALSLNPTLDRLYISYLTRKEIGVWTCTPGTLGAAITLDHIPSLMAARDGAAGQLITVAWSGDAHIYRVNSGGAVLMDVIVDNQLPEDIAVDSSSGYIFAALYEEPGRVAAVNATTGAVSYITVGSLPFRLIPGAAGEVMAVSDSDGSVSVINTASRSVAATVFPATPISDGAYLAGPGAYFMAEDVWKLSGRIPCEITARVSDTAGNAGTGRATIYVAPGVAAKIASR